MTAVLPDTFTVRPPTKEDAEAIFALVSAYNTAVVGFAYWTLDDVVDGLSGPDVEPATDAWLVLDGDTPIGYGLVFGKGDRRQLDLDLFTTDPVVETYLLGEISRRSREIARAYGQASAHLDAVVYRADEARRDRLSSDGFTPGTMHVDTNNPTPALGVYLSVGMQPTLVMEVWRRAVDAA